MTSRTSVVNISGDHEETVQRLAKHLGRDKLRRRLFDAVYGRAKLSQSKKVLMQSAGLKVGQSQQAQNQLDHLAKHHLISKSENAGQVLDGSRLLYGKDETVRANRAQIIALADNPKKAAKLVTKRNPGSSNVRPFEIKIVMNTKPAKVRMVRVEDIGEFKKVCGIKEISPLTPDRLSENDFKNGLVKLLSLRTAPKDWGGEINDIFAATILVGKKKMRGAFALKGPAKKGPLSPAMMGKNGDQIQRLFRSPADLFVVQYEGEVQQSVHEQMETFARARSALGADVHYAVFDDFSSKRLRIAYPKAFKSQ